MQAFHQLGLTVLLTAVIGILSASQVQAQGNVLLPSGDIRPNLGLTPRIAPAAPATLDTTAAKPDEITPAASSSAPSPVAAEVAPAAVLPSLDGSGEDDSYHSLSSPGAAITAGPTGPTTPTTTAGLGIPTTVFQQAPPGYLPPGSPRPANRMDIELSPKSVWGPQDIATVTTTLGIPANQVPSQCRLTVGGMIMGANNVYNFDTGGSQRADALYNGPVSNMVISANALCPAGQLPPYSGFIAQIGNQYSVTLGGIGTCPAVAPNHPPQTVSIQYNGNGNGDCRFQ